MHLLISTPGGQVREGMVLYNILRGLPLQLTTHNVGNVDSVGNVIFLAGTKRYACSNATFMFHGVGVGIDKPSRWEQKDLREKLGMIEADTARIADVIRERASFPNPDEVRELFLEARTEGVDYAKSKGIIHDIRDVSIPPGCPVYQLVFKRQGVDFGHSEGLGRRMEGGHFIFG